MLKKISLLLLVVFYVAGGVNHFVHPEAYLPIIPPYLPYPGLINFASGLLELILGTMLVFSKTRQLAAYGIVILLLLFIPTHIYMIQKGGCMSEAICIPSWVAWIRLFPLQLLLIGWAWWHRK
jgi:uncharacterized membrane protein